MKGPNAVFRKAAAERPGVRSVVFGSLTCNEQAMIYFQICQALRHRKGLRLVMNIYEQYFHCGDISDKTAAVDFFNPAQSALLVV